VPLGNGSEKRSIEHEGYCHFDPGIPTDSAVLCRRINVELIIHFPTPFSEGQQNGRWRLLYCCCHYLGNDDPHNETLKNTFG